jgi:2-iminobutanoate/2-iminopropanoate deaminase
LPKKHVATDEAPQPIGPYSQAVVAGGFLFVSGQVPIDPATGELIQGDIAQQTERVLQNLLAILRQARMGPEHVVKTTIFLADMGDFAKVNEVYGRYFSKELPARSTVQVAALPKNARIEIEVIATF